MKTQELSTSAKRMINKYGEAMCVEAYNLYDNGSTGASTVGSWLKVRTNTADALINAGEELSKMAIEQEESRTNSLVEKLDATAQTLEAGDQATTGQVNIFGNIYTYTLEVTGFGDYSISEYKNGELNSFKDYRTKKTALQVLKVKAQRWGTEIVK